MFSVSAFIVVVIIIILLIIIIFDQEWLIFSVFSVLLEFSGEDLDPKVPESIKTQYDRYLWLFILKEQGGLAVPGMPVRSSVGRSINIPNGTFTAPRQDMSLFTHPSPPFQDLGH